ncbi:MAG: glyoxalase/bleomycin resistance protein/dioxygenase [Planctomycetaceae bacterium]|nr:glyoxalase/bleomycin resistance protein/dioxygenase [Planctomycetaceae bacterium]
MVRFHLSLNVSNLPQAVKFLEGVLGVSAAKQRVDYAKFELDSPPLVLSLEPRSPTTYGSLNHLGFRFPDSKALVEAQNRIESAGVSTQREEGVECCYARQTKFWVHDLDQRLWEFYTLDEDLEHRGGGQTLEEMIGDAAAATVANQDAPTIWEHRMYETFTPPSSPCDEVRLRGSFNVPVSNADIQSQLAQAFETLKPGGQVTVHILTSEEAVTGDLHLPGPAAHVKYVPLRTDVLAAIEAAGFVDLQLSTFRSGACFEHEGVPLRETQIIARRPVETSSATCDVVFKGPFLSVTDDEGNEWRRGESVTISRSRWKALQQMPVGDMFVVLPESATVSHCGV